jgi:hypothetical protein
MLSKTKKKRKQKKKNRMKIYFNMQQSCIIFVPEYYGKAIATKKKKKAD